MMRDFGVNDLGLLPSEERGLLFERFSGQAMGIHPDAMRSWLAKHKHATPRVATKRRSQVAAGHDAPDKTKPTAEEMRRRVYRLRRQAVR